MCAIACADIDREETPVLRRVQEQRNIRRIVDAARFCGGRGIDPLCSQPGYDAARDQ